MRWERAVLYIRAYETTILNNTDWDSLEFSAASPTSMNLSYEDTFAQAQEGDLTPQPHNDCKNLGNISTGLMA
jgi:hypothetical protein